MFEAYASIASNMTVIAPQRTLIKISIEDFSLSKASVYRHLEKDASNDCSKLVGISELIPTSFKILECASCGTDDNFINIDILWLRHCI
jgi:hypothetical protein